MPENKIALFKTIFPGIAVLYKQRMIGIAIQIGVLFIPVSLAAQSSQEIFNQAVDRFNFATMQVVLADDKQKPEAGKLAARLDELNYNTDSLLKEVIKIYDLNSKTQELSVKINGFKSAYSVKKSIDKQLSQVIDFIVEDRKKKSYLPQLQEKLADIRKEAIELADENNQMMTASALQSSSASKLVSTQQAAFPDFMSIAVIIIGLISLVNLWFYYRIIQRRRNSSGEKDDYYKTVRQSIDFEIYPRLEKNNENLEKKIENLRQEIMALLKESHSQLQEPLIVKPIVTVPQKPVIEQKVTEPKPVMPLTVAQTNMPKVVSFQVAKPTPPEAPKPVKKYADYPKENGFVISQLQDISDRRSIYEITILANSEQASFSVVDNKELHEYAIQNRERLLKDACDFEISSSQHTKIEVIKPGMLLKNGNSWQIIEKAKIKFV
ncbi:hypothetical protein GXP67_15045 [Rhodocytophaga rosea]|uniref:Uncharacterized protein n=1 Tax=Rhodocytophaga rosea TaxID=2704465 RepID=A0A6C0GJM6_9BACT|nr:hypothetical protein [Rhodocytophaga rosea]QHT67862.1 hypothetical protein GXP67_15045 [Rhodocytophaga rosea]